MKLSPEVQEGIAAAAQGVTQPAEAQPTSPDPATPEAPAPGSTGGQSEAEAAKTPETPQPAEGAKPQQAEGEPAQPLNEEDVPTEYFGVDLSGIEPEARQKIIDEFKERDRFINKRLGEQKAGEETPPPQVQPQQQEPQQPVPQTDDDIMRMFGVDPDDTMYEVKKETMLPLAKVFVQQQQVVEEMANRQFMRDVVDQWNADMDSLTEQYGDLPESVSRDDVMEFAVRENITSPAEAYFKVMGPARQALAERAKTARAESVSRLTPASTTRPRTTAQTEEKPLTGMKVRDAVRIAAERAAESTGFDWAEAVAASNQQR